MPTFHIAHPDGDGDMIDLSSFSSLFPSLGSFFGPGGPLAPPPAPEPDTQDAAAEQDSLELSDPASRSIPSALSSASFDTPVEPDPIAVADDGTYAPSVQSTRQLSVSSAFAFNFSFQREVTATVREPAAREVTASEARLSALESRSLFYQSTMNESRGRVAGGYAESRTLQTELFYSRTRELSLSLPASSSDRFDEASAQVSRTFQLNISLDFSFLGQFTRQSESISSIDDALFGRYLDNTSGLSRESADAVQSFFDDIDRILDESEAFVASSLESFFDTVADQFGLSAEEAGMLERMVVEEVAAFFEDVDLFLSDARTALTEPAPAPEPAELPESPDPQAENPALAA